MPLYDANAPADLPLETGLRLLAKPQCRRIIRLLRETESLSLDSLTDRDRIASGDTTRPSSDDPATGLYHNHLPYLADADVIDWSPDDPATVARGPRYWDIHTLLACVTGYPGPDSAVNA